MTKSQKFYCKCFSPNVLAQMSDLRMSKSQTLERKSCSPNVLAQMSESEWSNLKILKFQIFLLKLIYALCGTPFRGIKLRFLFIFPSKSMKITENRQCPKKSKKLNFQNPTWSWYQIVPYSLKFISASKFLQFAMKKLRKNGFF